MSKQMELQRHHFIVYLKICGEDVSSESSAEIIGETVSKWSAEVVIAGT